ncbi:MAG TPA: TRAP transporter small permease [Cyclobacteriaceae bacterium]|nr:TRAP transporter small permease [Cyclobacteriaceae bacterium]
MTGGFLKYTLRFLKALYEHTEGFMILVLCTLLVADVLLGILSRYIRFEVVFANELGKYLFIWLCAIGISAAAKDNQHVRINFIVERFPSYRKITWIVSQLLFLVFTLSFFFLGLKLTLMHLKMGKSAMGFDFPIYIFTAAVPIGFGLTSIRLIRDIVHHIRTPKEAGKGQGILRVEEAAGAASDNKIQ